MPPEPMVRNLLGHIEKTSAEAAVVTFGILCAPENSPEFEIVTSEVFLNQSRGAVRHSLT